MYKSRQERSRAPVNGHINHQNVEICDLGDFNCGMVVGRKKGLFVSVTVDLFGFSHTIVSRGYTEVCEKQARKPKSRESDVQGQKYLVGRRGERRMARLVQVNTKTMVT